VSTEVSASVQPATGLQVRRLLAAYSDTLDTVDRLRWAPLVAVWWSYRSPRRTPLRLPRPAFMLRSVTVRHMERVLGPLEGRLRRRVALGTATPEETDAMNAVAGFRASLPTVSWRLRVGLLALGTLVLSRVLAKLVPNTLEVNFGFPGEADLNRLFDKTLAASQPTTGSVGSAIDSLFEASFAELAVVAVLLVLSLYLLLRPVMTSFRLKRMLFNLHPDAEHRIRDTPASWSVSRATGVYDLERSAFEQIARGRRPSRRST
jgi:hypothetical protein